MRQSDGPSLGEALGQRYVDVTFGPESKARMLKMVDALEKSLDSDIHDLSWMSEDTKKQAKVKLTAIRNKIGYPDVWRDYSSGGDQARRFAGQCCARQCV